MSPDMPDETMLGFDFGVKRIGVAVGTWAEDGRLRTARALTTIAAEANAARFDAIATLIKEWQPTRLIVGEPCHNDGTAHEMTARCTRFANQLRGRFALPVEQVDERFSSVEAETELRNRPCRQSRLSRAQAKQQIDAEAARIILERWFDIHSQSHCCPVLT
jgi:putative Holliday junction resolvase